MNYHDSDGYILIDMSIADISKSTQSIQGIYDRIVSVLDTNKLVLVINFGEYSPMPAIARKKLNYYVITTNLFIITINSNDIVIIEEAGESTVDVSIVPTYIEGTKIADYTIGEQEGSIYIPEVQSEINDNVTASNTTWSSDKISEELDLKADASSLASVATSGSYNDLTNKPVFADVAITGSYDDLIDKPTIPDELNDLDDVTLTSPTNGQTLVFDSTEGKFINQTPPSGVTTLAGLSDVDLTTPASGNILSFDGTNWTNETITAADIEYSSGVSVADKIDNLSYIETTSVDSNTGVTWTCKKYNNGDLEIWANKYYKPDASIAFNAWGNIFSTSFTVGTYPIAFYSTPCVIGQVQIENVGCVSSTQATSSTTTAPQISAIRGVAGTIETTFYINISLYARGRWKA